MIIILSRDHLPIIFTTTTKEKFALIRQLFFINRHEKFRRYLVASGRKPEHERQIFSGKNRIHVKICSKQPNPDIPTPNPPSPSWDAIK